MRKRNLSLAEPTTPCSGSPGTPGLWDSSRLAAYLGCSQRHLFNLRKRGLPSYRLGDMVRFDIEQVTAWMNSGNTGESSDLRQRQLADLASDMGDNAECAAADLQREFPQRP